jgi:hypothetical protein
VVVVPHLDDFERVASSRDPIAGFHVGAFNCIFVSHPPCSSLSLNVGG